MEPWLRNSTMVSAGHAWLQRRSIVVNLLKKENVKQLKDQMGGCIAALSKQIETHASKDPNKKKMDLTQLLTNTYLNIIGKLCLSLDFNALSQKS